LGTDWLVEIKTSNTKSFNAVVKNGVQREKPQHYAQMQIYMGYLGLPHAVYLVVCKETDAVHVEEVEFCQEEFDRLKTLARDIIDATEPPPRVADSPLDRVCAWCDFSGICHNGDVPRVDCRTCLHCTPVDGGWTCDVWKAKTNDLAKLRAACPRHVYISPLLGDVVDYDQEMGIPVRWVQYQEFRNGEGGMSSVDIFNRPNNRIPGC